MSEDVTVQFNLNMPTDDAELMNAIATMRNLGAMSVTTAMERSGMINDVQVEKERLESDSGALQSIGNSGVIDGGYEKTTRD